MCGFFKGNLLSFLKSDVKTVEVSNYLFYFIGMVVFSYKNKIFITAKNLKHAKIARIFQANFGES